MRDVVRAVPTLGPEPRIKAMGVVDMAFLWRVGSARWDEWLASARVLAGK